MRNKTNYIQTINIGDLLRTCLGKLDSKNEETYSKMEL